MVANSNSGKSTLALKLISDPLRYFPEDFERIYYIWPHKAEASMNDRSFLSRLRKCHKNVTILYRMIEPKDLATSFKLNERTLVILGLAFLLEKKGNRNRKVDLFFDFR